MTCKTLVGAAKSEITPETSVWLDGMVRTHRSVGVHDPLFARAVSFGQDPDMGQTVVVASVDVCMLRTADALAVRQRVSAHTGIPADQIIIAATHTHSGPATFGYFNPSEESYVRELVEKLVIVIEQAVASARPAAVGCSSAFENTISQYRRLLARDGRVVMNWEPYRPEEIVGPLGQPDPEVGVLKAVSAEDADEVICILFNHAGHPNVMSGDNYLISADYPGVAARLLESRFGGVATFLNGAEGSVDIDGVGDRDWAEMERVGATLAGVVEDAAQSIEVSKAAALSRGVISYCLPRRKITESEKAWAEDVLKSTGGAVSAIRDGVGDDYLALFYKEMLDAEGSELVVTQTCFAIDDCAFLSFPGEPFTEIGLRIKAESPFRYTHIIGLANGNVGYIATREAMRQGGYEVDTRRVEPEAEDVIVEQSLGLLRQVHGSWRLRNVDIRR